MSKQRYKEKNTTQTIIDTTIALPVDRPVGLYYRQSTDSQVGNIATAIQTVDMAAYLERLGWHKDNITLIDVDAGVSGTKKIDERLGMRQLFELITNSKVAAAACQDEDRLFRDVTQIQVNIFIEACRKSHVLVITPSMIYDFAHPQMGTFHARQFRFKCEMAAEYIESYIRGRLHRAKERLMMEGRWAGGSIPPGFMVDMRKELPDGSKNENWRRYAPFQPYAQIVNEYFRLFLSNGGNFGETLRYIYEHNLAYPDPAACPPPQGYKTYYGTRRQGNGYYPSRPALKDILTNSAYIGHWCVNDVIVRWNNHPAIVPVDVFMRAFNYLSEFSLDGTPNPHYRPFRQYSRPSLDAERPVERPLCEGMIESQINGELHNVGIEYVKREKHYKYKLYTKETFSEYVWSKSADWIDEAVTKCLAQKLHATFDSEVWKESLNAFDEDYKKERQLKVSQLTALEQAMQNLIGSIEALTNPQMIRAVEVRYAEAKREQARLMSELSVLETEKERRAAIYGLRDFYEPTLQNWGNMNRDEKRVVLQAFILWIEATQYSKHGLQLAIHWRDGNSDEVHIPRLPTKGDGFSYEETELVKALLDAHAPQVEIAAALPNRRWKAIRDKIFRMRGSKVALFTPKPIRDFETYDDYVKRVGEPKLYEEKACHTWRRDEIQLLNEMLAFGAYKMEIAQAFPYRKWTHIRTKVSKLKGHDFEIPGDKQMRYTESYYMYQRRIQADGKDASSITTQAWEHAARPRRSEIV